MPVRVRIAEECVRKASGMVRISKNTKSTISKTEGVLDGTRADISIGISTMMECYPCQNICSNVSV